MLGLDPDLAFVTNPKFEKCLASPGGFHAGEDKCRLESFLNNSLGTTLGRGFPVNQVAGRSWSIIGPIPAIIIAALPKCPFCLLAYFGIVGTVAVDPLLYRNRLLPLIYALSCAPVAMLVYRARRQRGLAPFFVTLVAVIVIFISKFCFDYQLLVYICMLVMLSASIWNSWPKKKETSAKLTCHC